MFVVLRSSTIARRTTASFGSIDAKPWRQRNNMKSKLPALPPRGSQAPMHQLSKSTVTASRPRDAAALEQKVIKRMVAKIKEKTDSNLFALISSEDVQFRMYPLSVHEAPWLPVTESSIHISLIEKIGSDGSSERLLRVALHQEKATKLIECCQGLRFLMKPDNLQTVALLTRLQVRILQGVDLDKVLDNAFLLLS